MAVINCHVKKPVHLKLPLPPTSDDHVTGAGCHVIDVEIGPPPLPIRQVVFKNRYAHTVSIKYSSPGRSGEDPWRPCPGGDRTLMPSCHCEGGSQDWFKLDVDIKEEVDILRLVLRQPSPNWNSFGIMDLSIRLTESNEVSKGGVVGEKGGVVGEKGGAVEAKLNKMLHIAQLKDKSLNS